MIRPFRPEDEHGLVRVWLASTIPGQDFLSEQYWRSMEPTIREKYLPVAETWVVEEEGEIVAFMALLDDMIGGLFTHPDQQGRGYGCAFIEHARRRFESVYVEVFEANENAVCFYRRRGFVDHKRKIDEGTGLPLLILRARQRRRRRSGSGEAWQRS